MTAAAWLALGTLIGTAIALFTMAVGRWPIDDRRALERKSSKGSLPRRRHHRVQIEHHPPEEVGPTQRYLRVIDGGNRKQA